MKLKRRTRQRLAIAVALAASLTAVHGFLSPSCMTTQRQTSPLPPSLSIDHRGGKRQHPVSFFASIENERQQQQEEMSSSKENSTAASSTTTAANANNNNHHQGFRSTMHDVYTLPRTAYRIYISYFDKLWTATNTSARTKIANDKVRTAVRQVQSILQNTGDYYDNDNSNDNGNDTDGNYSIKEDVETRQAKESLLKACDNMLMALHVHDAKVESTVATAAKIAALVTTPTTLTATPSLPPEAAQSTADGQNNNKIESSTVSTEVAVTSSTSPSNKDPVATAAAPKKKQQRSILFGAVMGAVVACWVFSGNYLFTGLFCLMTILGQLEYYRMVMSTGVFPARRISVIGATSMFVTALFAPHLHEICLPMFGLWAMIWKLTMRRQIATIPEICTTFTGMFYLGYVPSFWVRTRLLGATALPTRLYPFTTTFRNYMQDKFGFLVPQILVENPITTGSVFIFWSWLSLAFSDVGAYFVGRKYGKTKLGAISPAAGATSPNKSVEGVVGGCVTSAILSVFGAWVQKWPYFVVTGAVHGTILALLGLIGDLTASMLKRDAGIKDFGDLIPEHGGILDRVDSFVWTAPYSWLVCAYIIPALRKLAGQV